MYVNFLKMFADQINADLEGVMKSVNDCFIERRPLSTEEWSKLNTLLITVKVGLRTDEENAKKVEESTTKW